MNDRGEGEENVRLVATRLIIRRPMKSTVRGQPFVAIPL